MNHYFFFQAEAGIRDSVASRGIGDVYKMQHPVLSQADTEEWQAQHKSNSQIHSRPLSLSPPCPLYTTDAADDLHCVDLGGRRIIKKKIFLISVKHI